MGCFSPAPCSRLVCFFYKFSSLTQPIFPNYELVIKSPSSLIPTYNTHPPYPTPQNQTPHTKPKLLSLCFLSLFSFKCSLMINICFLCGLTFAGLCCKIISSSDIDWDMIRNIKVEKNPIRIGQSSKHQLSIQPVRAPFSTNRGQLNSLKLSTPISKQKKTSYSQFSPRKYLKMLIC